MSTLLIALVGVQPAAATLGTNDYPSNLATAAPDTIVDPWQFYNRECVSFVAWRLNNDNGVGFSNNMTGPNGRRGHFGNAYQWKDNAIDIGYTYNGTAISGAAAWWAASYHGAGSYGHVAYVDSVNADGSIVVEEYNAQASPNDHNYRKRTISAGTSWPSGFIHIKDFVTPQPPAPPLAAPNVDPVRLIGDFTGDGKSDIVAVTPRGTSNPTGVNLSMLQSSGTAINNVGLWYYSTDVDIHTSRYLTGDFNGDGKADVALITPRGSIGINLSMLLSTGSGFTYSGLWYYDTGADITTARYAVGDFVGSDGKSDIAAVTSRGQSGGTSGVNISMLQSSGTAISNVGLWYYDTGVDINTSRYVAGDFNTDGKLDVAAVTPRGDMGINISFLQQTTTPSFSNMGLWYYDNGVDPTNSRYVAGDFTGDGKVDIAAVTSRGNTGTSGVNISMLQDTGTAFSNIGLWYYDNGVDIVNSRYIVGDFNADTPTSKADVALVTPRGSIGINLSMIQSSGTGMSNVGLWYYDTGVDINNSQFN